MSNGLRLAGSGGSQVLRASVLDQQLDRKVARMVMIEILVMAMMTAMILVIMEMMMVMKTMKKGKEVFTFCFQPFCKEESKCIEEEETGGSNHDKQQTENTHNQSNGNNNGSNNGSNESNRSSNGSNGSNKDKDQTEKRHSWRLEMFEDQQVVVLLNKQKKLFMFNHV